MIHWKILSKIWYVWEISDWVLLLMTIALVQSVLVGIFSLFCKRMEKRRSTKEVYILLKNMTVYLLFIMPIVSVLVLYFSTFSDITPFAEYGVESELYSIRNQSFSTFDHGNDPIFILLFTIWIFGVLYIMMFRFLKEVCMLHRLKKHSFCCEDSEISEWKAVSMREYKIKKPIDIRMIPALPIPFTDGIFLPVIYFPNSAYAKEDMRFLLRHEIIHLKNRDILYRRFLLLLCIICWFNPFMYCFADYFIQISEMVCDEEILKGVSKKERYQYASLLCSMTMSENNTVSPFILPSFAGEAKSSLEKRLINMLKTEKEMPKRVSVIPVILALSACFIITMAVAGGVSEFQFAVIKTISLGWAWWK